MKNYRNALILLLVVFQSKAQFDYTKFSIRPFIGIGHNLRSPAEVTLGQDVMEVINKSFSIGQLTNSIGNERFVFSTTNNIGLSAEYTINRDISFGAALSRFSRVFSTNSPDNWNSGGSTTQWVSNIKYNSIGVYAKKTWYGFQNNRFVKVGLNNTFSKKYPFQGSGGNGDFSINGTGVFVDNVDSKNPLFLNSSIGISRKNGRIIPFRHEISAGINLPLTYLEKLSFNYLNNSKITGTNEVKLSQTALWLEVGFPIEIIRHRTKIVNKHKEEPKPQTKKPEIKYEGKKINLGESILLYNINFEQGSDILTYSSRIELNKLVQLMNQNKQVKIIIAGHTSNEGDRDANINLSKKRAESCKKYLKEQGIKSKRIETKGFGPDFPISKTNKELNRRVEFKMID